MGYPEGVEQGWRCPECGHNRSRSIGRHPIKNRGIVPKWRQYRACLKCGSRFQWTTLAGLSTSGVKAIVPKRGAPSISKK